MVKSMIPILAIVLWVLGCSYFKDPFLQIVETQPPLVRNCSFLGVVTETSDADRILSHAAWHATKVRVKERAIELGATHIIWLHNTEGSIAAEAYQCPAE